MGTWGQGAFENDDAMDWLAELEEADDHALLIDVVGDVADLSDVEPLEIGPAARAVAGVAVVAACLDRATDGLPQGARDWVTQRHGTPVPNHLARKAGRALERVLRQSELRDLWDASPDHAAWVAGIERLRARLP